MDPISLGALAVAALASRASDAAGDKLGDAAWHAVSKFFADLRSSTHGPAREVIERIGTAGEVAGDRSSAAASVDELFEKNDELKTAFQSAIDQLQATADGVSFIAHAYDQARQINVSGNNFGPITMN